MSAVTAGPALREPKASLAARLWSLTRNVGPVDPVLAAIVVMLICFGVVMVYSASHVEGTINHRDANYFLKRQLIYAGLAFFLTAFVSRIDYHHYRKLTYPILISVAGLMVACIVGLGRRGGGATRWIALGPVHIQPAELAKLALVMWLAYSLAKKADAVKTFKVGFLPHLIIAGLMVFLCMKQPDFGSAVVLLLLTFTLMFIAGAKVGYLLGALLIGSAGAAVVVRFRAYRWQRVLAWMDMEAHRQDLAYQPFQARISFGSGGVTGLGLGKGLQTLYLPEAHTDFVGAVIGEELGYIGVCLLCLAYVVLVARGVRAAWKASDDYGTYLAFGISTLFGLQALINLSVAMSLLPTKGLTLPFISFGGSSLLVNAVAAGVLLNVSRHAQAHEELARIQSMRTAGNVKRADKAEAERQANRGRSPESSERQTERAEVVVDPWEPTP